MRNSNPLKILIEPKLPGILIPLLIAIFLWAFPYLFSGTYVLWPSEKTPLVNWLNDSVEITPFFSMLFGLLFTFFIGFLLIQFNKKFSFIRIRSLLLFFFYILLTGTNISLHAFDFSQVSSLFIVISLWQLFSIFDEKQPVIKSYNIGLFLAIGSLFSIEVLLLTPLFFIGIHRLKNLSIRALLARIIGLTTPFILFLCIAYLSNENINTYINLFLNQFKFEIDLHFDYITIAYLLILSLISFVALLNIINDPFSDKIKVGRMLRLISYMFFLFLLLFFMRSSNTSLIFSLGSLFMTMLYTHYFSLRINIFTKILFFLLIAVCLSFYLSKVIPFSLPL